MKKRVIATGIFLLIIIIFSMIVLAAPTFIFNFKDPIDITSVNLFAKVLNISYNISDSAGINVSTVQLFYKVNDTVSDCFSYTNSSSICGFQTQVLNQSNISNIWFFKLREYMVYPATYNFNEIQLELEPKSAYSLDSDIEFIKIQFQNVSNIKNFSFFEFYADNQTAASDTLRIYYCNSSYTTGSVTISSFCTAFSTLPASQVFNHTHSPNSKHHIVPFAIDTSSGQIGGVYVTPVSYFLLRGRITNGWNVYYINNISRTSAIQFSTNNGIAWIDLSGTVDAHLHQFNGDTLYYYVCANNTINEQNCSIIRQDLLKVAGLPPSSPNIFHPTESSYTGLIAINYTAAVSPNTYQIAFYNITLYNSTITQEFVKTIISNNSNNLSYLWNSTSTSEGRYNIHVTACDVNGLCSTGESEGFTLDHTSPLITLISPANVTSVTAGSISFTFNVSDANNVSNCSLIVDNSIATTLTSITNTTTISHSLSAGTFSWHINCTDEAGNVGNSSARTLIINPSPVEEEPSESGGGGYPDFKIGELNLTEEFSKKVYKHWSITFIVEEETHKIEVRNINKTGIEIEVSSEPQKAMVENGQEKLLQITENYDLLVRLNAIEFNSFDIPQADITLKILEKVIIQKPKEEQEVITEKTPSEMPKRFPFLSSLLIFILIIGLVTAIFSAFILFRVEPKYFWDELSHKVSKFFGVLFLPFKKLVVFFYKLVSSRETKPRRNFYIVLKERKSKFY